MPDAWYTVDCILKAARLIEDMPFVLYTIDIEVHA